MLYLLRAFVDDPKRNQLVVTAVSWSSTGQTIAVAYGRCAAQGACREPRRL